MEKEDHCLGACYRVGNIYVISTARDNTRYLHGPPSSSSLESHPKVNSFSRFHGLEPLASERGVASVGDPANRGERLGDSVVTSNALSRPFFLFALQLKEKNRQFSLNFLGSSAFHETF